MKSCNKSVYNVYLDVTDEDASQRSTGQRQVFNEAKKEPNISKWTENFQVMSKSVSVTIIVQKIQSAKWPAAHTVSMQRTDVTFKPLFATA